jgi:hypothetical protein
LVHREEVVTAVRDVSGARLTRVVDAIGWPRSSFYHRRIDAAKLKPKGPPPDWMSDLVRGLAKRYPFWGYKRIAVICRRRGHKVSDKKAYRIFKTYAC